MKKFLVLAGLVGACFISGAAMADPFGMTCSGTILKNGTGNCSWRTTTSSESNYVTISNDALRFGFGGTTTVLQSFNFVAGTTLYGSGTKTGNVTICAYNVARTVRTCAVVIVK